RDRRIRAPYLGIPRPALAKRAATVAGDAPVGKRWRRSCDRPATRPGSRRRATSSVRLLLIAQSSDGAGSPGHREHMAARRGGLDLAMFVLCGAGLVLMLADGGRASTSR